MRIDNFSSHPSKKVRYETAQSVMDFLERVYRAHEKATKPKTWEELKFAIRVVDLRNFYTMAQDGVNGVTGLRCSMTTAASVRAAIGSMIKGVDWHHLRYTILVLHALWGKGL